MALPKKRHSTLRKGRRRAALLKNYKKRNNIPLRVKKQNQKDSETSAISGR